ncbi:unnamed protein product [Soboliphyme baturini]|uniref:Reverse transcriptase domain-containing protein n=1 Tax=Soboliphyme baturini TaxID=241478 RepID=A0A183IMB2_9BILA|nr:unnamed protein product [Soboliphyme baturini]
MCKVVSTVGLDVNLSKTKIMEAPDLTNGPRTERGEPNIEEIKNFKYYGSVLARAWKLRYESRAALKTDICELRATF